MEDIQEQGSEEKAIPVSRVNEIVKREKLDAAERERKRLEAEYEVKIAQIKAAIPAPMGGMQQDNSAGLDDKIRQMIGNSLKEYQDLYEQEQQKRQMAEVADRYFNKMSGGKEKFQDFEEIMADFDPKEFPAIAFMAADLENAAEVMYELNKNPAKLADLEVLANKSPKMAQKAMRSLAESISKNNAAKDNYVASPEPLRHSKPSLNSGLDVNRKSVSDFKNADWLRV